MNNCFDRNWTEQKLLPVRLNIKNIDELRVIFHFVVFYGSVNFSDDVMVCVVSLIAKRCTLSIMEDLLWEAR